MTRELALDAKTTALVLVDILNFTVSAPVAPHDGATVAANAVRLAQAARKAGALVVLVNVYADRGPLFSPPADVSMPRFEFPPGAADFPPGLEPVPGDLVITKSRWGAFRDTELDARLRARGVETLIIGGIATNFGVEATIRQAHEDGYAQVIAEDACAAFSAEEHAFPLKTIVPRIAKIRSTEELCAALAAST